MIRLLSIGIGRGHPFYMDGVAQALRSLGAEDRFVVQDVFEVSRFPALAGWRAMAWMYHRAGRTHGPPRLYRKTRRWVAGPVGAALARSLCGDFRRTIAPGDICVVDHPVLVQGLAEVDNLFYQHGELGVPAEAVVRGNCRVLVPTEAAADRFEAGGFSRSALEVTGLCVEDDLAQGARSWARQRAERLAGSEPLCVAVFSSGAESESHLDTMVPAVLAMLEAGHRPLVFARRAGRLEKRFRRWSEVECIGYTKRDELDRVTVANFPAFDAILSPAHERCHWGLGLGLPFLMVGPDIGPFPPENRTLLLAAGVAREVDSPAAARSLGAELSAWRHKGELAEMSRCGQALETDGFQNAGYRILEAADAVAEGRG